MDIKSRLRELKAEIGPTLKEVRFMIGRIRKSPLSIVGTMILLFYLTVAILAPVLAPTPEGARDPYFIPRDGWTAPPKSPSEEHIFGTTQWQFDMYYGCIWGARTAFRIGAIVVFAALAIGLSVGTISGYFGGIYDELMMRFTDIIWAFPGLILAMALVTVFGPSLDSITIALTVVGWPSYARVTRGQVLKVKVEDYVEAARAVGCSHLRVIFRHVLPNAIFPVVIMASLDIGAVVLSAAALSFLGLGPPSGYADWGQLISMSRGWIYASPQNPLEHWHTWAIPGVFIFTFVLGWNLLGDALRDILDPTLRRR